MVALIRRARIAAFLPELFPARLRYTGASATSFPANTLGGGFAPLVATWLNSHRASPLALGGTRGQAVPGQPGLCALALPETRDREFDL
jgi:hypothetical protein